MCRMRSLRICVQPDRVWRHGHGPDLGRPGHSDVSGRQIGTSLARTCFALLACLALAPTAQAADNRPVTQEQFRQLVKIFKNVVNRLDKVEADVKDLESRGTSGGARKNEVVDLGAP